MIDLTAIDDSIGYMTEMRSLCSVPDGNVAKAYDTALACLRECAERQIEPTRNETLDNFMDALVHCDTVKVILTGIGETAWDTKTIYEAIAEGCGRKLERSGA